MVVSVLPPAAWRGRDDLARLTEVLGAGEGETRLVGGAVRDTMLGIDVADIDLATRLLPDAVVARCKAAGIRVVPTGIAHGTVTAVLEGGPVEVTTLRRDLSTDGRHAVVGFTDDWREDAARRDFTMNALYADPTTGVIVDYFGGLGDLAAGRVRFIGDPLQRIAEDHLRILRFFRFHARFGDTVDAAGLAACAARANDLMALSRERIAAELLKLLVARHAVEVVGLMIERGVLRPVLPEIVRVDALRELASNEGAAEIVVSDPIRRLAALLPRDPQIGESIAARLKLSKSQRRRLVLALTDRQGSPYEDAYRVGRDAAIDRQLLTAASFDAVIGARHLTTWPIPQLPIAGGALVTRGLRQGPAVAATLKAIETRWIGEGFASADRVEAIADEEVAQALAASSTNAASPSSGRA